MKEAKSTSSFAFLGHKKKEKKPRNANAFNNDNGNQRHSTTEVIKSAGSTKQNKNPPIIAAKDQENTMVEITKSEESRKGSSSSSFSFKKMMMRIPFLHRTFGIPNSRDKPAEKQARVYSVFEKQLTENDIHSQLLIPTKFASYFPSFDKTRSGTKEPALREIELQFIDPDGQSWEIHWVKVDLQYYFTGAWKNLVAVHELKAKDVIVIELSDGKQFPIRFKRQINVVGSSAAVAAASESLKIEDEKDASIGSRFNENRLFHQDVIEHYLSPKSESTSSRMPKD